ncbi:uncharacterized protein N7446_005951 [Penicillium canescens]|uniref:tyrosinase n=1 Tax=Penicillium canescens TaxID=5083 RepID=A0AAD6IJM2_PENCN|nr:uncharacterized protein N7446_005951 [Penicillium canescens]KAJ6051319.1 hypothetical protein N7460_001853 [Penicillium canescens]KAJ6061831.1 hypothetical protein N7446_005951 [Penicillium canescens]KAJ6065080.1 hypothetical protein N7444_000733 [Penicillium canescens]
MAACQYLEIRASTQSKQPPITRHPTWDAEVRALFSEPYWTSIDSDPESIGAHWISQMREYSPSRPAHMHLDLSSMESVQQNIITIYQHLRSRSMPITKNQNHYWPEEALETLRLWANQGFRRSFADPIQYQELIKAPNHTQINTRVRKDIFSLSPSEIQAYREKLDDVLQVGTKDSKWQELGLLHAEWCLHYQEAFVFWHRAYLKYVEELIDFPIPYWNGFAVGTGDPSSPYAGLPSIFLDDVYTHSNGEQRKNPLKYALSLNGKNRLGTSEYVERSPELVEGRSNPLWSKKIHLFNQYHQQIAHAFAQPEFSLQEAHGYPWANIPDFSENQPDNLYPEASRKFFDGLFEQVHDNFHGLIGPDMADNSYTAFDPIFLSYHANMDRIAEVYLRTNPARQFSSNFPLRPFVDNGTGLAYDDPREYVYTTLGDMAKQTPALKYRYALPSVPDFLPISQLHFGTAAVPQGGTAFSLSTAKPLSTTVACQGHETVPYIVFSSVSCLKQSFVIDVFVSGAESLESDPIRNPDYIGSITRLGMGNGRGEEVGIRNPQRCMKKPITRVLQAAHVKEKLKNGLGVQQIVTELSTGRHLEEEEWKGMPGFEGNIVWS